jgi:hypothetical protein
VDENIRPSGHDRYICATDGSADHIGKGGALIDLARSGGDAQELAPRLLQQIRDCQDIVDVIAGIGVEEDGDSVGHAVV